MGRRIVSQNSCSFLPYCATEQGVFHGWSGGICCEQENPWEFLKWRQENRDRGVRSIDL